VRPPTRSDPSFTGRGMGSAYRPAEPREGHGRRSVQSVSILRSIGGISSALAEALAACWAWAAAAG
jgi:hypothetical protein